MFIWNFFFFNFCLYAVEQLQFKAGQEEKQELEVLQGEMSRVERLHDDQNCDILPYNC